MKQFEIAVLAFMAAMVFAVLEGSVARGQETSTGASEEFFSGGDRVTRAPAAAAAGRNALSRKRYAGGADEDDLQVQETLPIPSRTYDGTVAPSSGEAGASESPTND